MLKHSIMRSAMLLCLFILSAIFVNAQVGKTPVEVTDMLKIKTINGVSLSSDGKKMIFTVNSIEPEPANKLEYKYVNSLWIANTDGITDPKQLTFNENASQGAISPDGKLLAFVRAVDGRAQVFLLPLEAGEAYQLTRIKTGASNPKWSPDGKKLIFSSSIPIRELAKDSLLNPGYGKPGWPGEKPGIGKMDLVKAGVNPDPDGNLDEVRAYLEKNEMDKKAKVLTKLNFQDESDVNAEMNFNHFYIIDAVRGATPKPITSGFYRFNGADFMPNGKQLILSADIDSLQHPDRSMETAIFIANTDGSGLRKLFGEEGKSFNNPVVSPSGKFIAFQFAKTEFVGIPVLGVARLDDPGLKITEYNFDRNKSNITWSEDEMFLYFISQANGGAPLYRMSTQTQKLERLTAADKGVTSFSLEKGRLLYSRTEISSPSELYLAKADGKDPVRIGNFNAHWVEGKKISIPEKRTFKNSIGQEIEYWIMKPADYREGNKYPLLLEIHGGPASMWGPGESNMWHEYQYFCSKGYGVVYCNPRGSGGYGQDFLRSNIRDWTVGPADDVMTALKKTTNEKWVDTSKLLITGGSYAGFLVAWIISQDHRFRAACAQRGVYDLSTFFGEGNAWRLVPNYFGGYPWEKEGKEILDRESPINYVNTIKTPLIIFHGENDRRTGVIQSEMLYRSLKILGRPVEYVRHPGGTHELTRSGNNRQRIDQMLRTWEFFTRSF